MKLYNKYLLATIILGSVFTLLSCSDDEPDSTLSEKHPWENYDRENPPHGEEWIDPTFAKALQEEEYITDAATVTPLDVELIEKLYLDECLYIQSLRGIEYFKNLKELDCDDNKIKELDLSHNLLLQEVDCSYNPLTKLILPKNECLRNISCNRTAIEILEIPNPGIIEGFGIGGPNLKLTSLDFSEFTALKSLEISYCQIATINLKNCTELFSLSCEKTLISELDLSDNKKIERLICKSSKLTSLDVTGLPLKEIDCYNNELTELDLTGTTAYQERIIVDGNPGDNKVFKLAINRFPSKWINNTSVDKYGMPVNNHYTYWIYGGYDENGNYQSWLVTLKIDDKRK